MQWIWRIFGQRPRLEVWEARPFSAGVELGPRAGDARDCHERTVAREGPGPPAPGGPHRRVARAILSYRIFPPRLVTGVLRRAEVRVGDVAGIRYHLAPGLDLFFAARVTDRFDRLEGNLWRTGFSYRTLEGHPECGEETFCVEKDLDTGAVRVALRSWSRPGILLARVLRPLTRALQLHAGRAALDHLARVATAAVETFAGGGFTARRGRG
jgi:hypothetical protein